MLKFLFIILSICILVASSLKQHKFLDQESKDYGSPITSPTIFRRKNLDIFTRLEELSVAELLKSFSERRITVKQYAQLVLQAKEDYAAYNFYSYFDENEFLRNAEESDKRYEQGTARQLEGLPISIKDNIDIEGDPNSAGTPALFGRFPKRTSALAKILIHNGAIKAGRTVMHELALGITSNNPFTGPCHNPFNFEFSCGGSSGGSGAVGEVEVLWGLVLYQLLLAQTLAVVFGFQQVVVI